MTGLLDLALSKVIQEAVAAGVASGLRRHANPVPRQALSVAETAESLGVTPSTVRKLIADGHLPSTRLGPKGQTMVTIRDLDQFLDNHRNDAGEFTGLRAV